MNHKIIVLPAVAVLTVGAQVAFGQVASAHNRAQNELPNGGCVVVGSEKSVEIPGRGFLDLIDEGDGDTRDQVGGSFAAFQGQSHLEIGDCSGG